MKKVLLFLVLGAVLFFCIKDCRSLAEITPDAHSWEDMRTPDPNTDIYDLIDEYERSPQLVISEGLRSEAQKKEQIDTRNPPRPVVVKYDPFLAYLQNGSIVYKRLNGTQIVLNTPLDTSYLHNGSVVGEYDNSSGDLYSKYFDYDIYPDGINKSSTEHYANEAYLVYILNWDWKTNNNTYRVGYSDTIVIDFFPCLKYFCSVDSSVPHVPISVDCTIGITDRSNSSQKVQLRMPQQVFYMKNDGSDRFTLSYNVSDDPAGIMSPLSYVSSVQIVITVNASAASSLTSGTGGQAAPTYWFAQYDQPELMLNVYNRITDVDKIGGFFTNLLQGIENIFVPSQELIDEWAESHLNDELDEDNPLNLVYDIYVHICQYFAGSRNAQPRPISVPALKFNINGVGTVTPFEGYTWDIGSEGVVDNSGRNLWYYVRLANSVCICGGFVSVLWRMFKRWYDLHYAGDGG